ncbi:MAG: PIN domain-containing protein [Defluviitaleaceae bacterium]|nr:PIN domain-containing protein [Defluviitaleaceae bacterium]
MVRDILTKASNKDVTISMAAYNLLEVYYQTYRKGGSLEAQEMLAKVDGLPIRIVREMTRELLEEAGRLKGSYKLSLADAVALAEASLSGGALVTADHHEMDIIERQEKINFCWIR